MDEFKLAAKNADRVCEAVSHYDLSTRLHNEFLRSQYGCDRRDSIHLPKLTRAYIRAIDRRDNFSTEWGYD